MPKHEFHCSLLPPPKSMDPSGVATAFLSGKIIAADTEEDARKQFRELLDQHGLVGIPDGLITCTRRSGGAP